MKTLLLAGFAALALSPLTAAARPMTAVDLASMKRIGAPTVSPDGRWLVYQLRETDLAANRGRIDLWLIDLSRPNQAPVKVASTQQANEHDPRFSGDGRWLYFLSNSSGDEQVWRVSLPIGRPEQVTRVTGGVGGYLPAPSGDKIAIWADRNQGCSDLACAGVAEPQEGGSGRVYDEIFVRHWDSWETPNTYSRIFVLPLVNGRATGQGTPVAPALRGHAPTRPFGGAEELAWTPDGRTLFFTLREAGRSEPTSTNLDIYAVRDGGAPQNLTAANRAMDASPSVSPDGRWLAYTAMARPGYEADRQIVYLRNIETGATRALTGQWDRSVASINWAPDGRSLLVTAQDTLDTPLFRVDIGSGRVTRITQGGTVGNVVPLADGSIVYTLNSIEAPDDLYRLPARGGVPQRLTNVNAALLAQLDPVSVRRFSFVGANRDRVWGQIVKPQSASRSLPVAYLIHGGPQGSFNNSWSYRWNPRLFSAPGYASVSVDFHGSTGYGQAFTDAIRQNWGSAPLEDLRLGLAAAGREDPQIDIRNACALGGSYGGYMVNWIAGNWPDGFKCLVSHAGIMDTRIMAYETEEMWFTEWENGGVPWERGVNETIERYNPIRFVQNWRTPMLVIHGERDFRIPYSQSLAMFNALQRRNIASRLVVYPDENHWILKPQNSIQWYREVHGWLGQHLQPGAGPVMSEALADETAGTH